MSINIGGVAVGGAHTSLVPPTGSRGSSCTKANIYERTRGMPIRGQESISLPYQVLTSRDGIYFSSIVLSMWDNIHGPKVLMTWKGSESVHKVLSEEKLTDLGAACGTVISDGTLLTIANFTLNDEAGRVEKLEGIETKFYCLKKYECIASVSIFPIEVYKGKTEVFSFILILPHCEISEFLPRHSICESKVQRLLKEYLVLPLKDMAMDRSPVQNKVSQVLMGFHGELFKFTQVMLSITKFGLPSKINISETYLNIDPIRQADLKGFLLQVITAHLQSSGYTVIIGSNKADINKMIMTLGVFLSSKERKMSQLLKQEDVLYEPDLFLQGLIVSAADTCILPFTKENLYFNKLPPTIVHLDSREVFVFEQKIPKFIRRKENQGDEYKPIQKRSELLNLKELSLFNKEYSSRIVQDFLEHLYMLPMTPGVKEAFVTHFFKQLRLKALALAKYVDAEPKSNIQELATEMLALGRGANIAERHKINQASLQQDLSIDNVGDLYIILAFAEKIRPRTYLDVLGDPQLNDLIMIKEFQNL